MVEAKPEKTPEVEPEKKPEQPSRREAEGVTAVKEEPTLVIEGEDNDPLTPTEFVESLGELKDKAKAAGLRPIRKMLSSYVSQGLSVVDGLLESLEGKKKKK
jgi:hypothetical protein|tara:strand:+ start:1033 stop:1338 length:306 start_codon:yes stop_codon:yes gene_type:complete